jgi:hypothetical protein
VHAVFKEKVPAHAGGGGAPPPSQTE